MRSFLCISVQQTKCTVCSNVSMVEYSGKWEEMFIGGTSWGIPNRVFSEFYVYTPKMQYPSMVVFSCTLSL
jgi:hypothetical protein